jgi:hypothetical protein
VNAHYCCIKCDLCKGQLGGALLNHQHAEVLGPVRPLLHSALLPAATLLRAMYAWWAIYRSVQVLLATACFMLSLFLSLGLSGCESQSLSSYMCEGGSGRVRACVCVCVCMCVYRTGMTAVGGGADGVDTVQCQE